jgi:hypothetical protein
MSQQRRSRPSKYLKRACAACQERRARFRYRGEVRADRDHTLCFECYRGEVNRARARRLSAAARCRGINGLERHYDETLITGRATLAASA